MVFNFCKGETRQGRKESQVKKKYLGKVPLSTEWQWREFWSGGPTSDLPWYGVSDILAVTLSHLLVIGWRWSRKTCRVDAKAASRSGCMIASTWPTTRWLGGSGNVENQEKHMGNLLQEVWCYDSLESFLTHQLVNTGITIIFLLWRICAIMEE